MTFDWSHNPLATLDPRDFTCGYCGAQIASEKGYKGFDRKLGRPVYLFMCHKCGQPTFFDADGKQTPGEMFGNPVQDVPDTVNALYNEARRCISCNSYTASVLCSRKILMNIGVSKGAKEGLPFVEYIEYLAAQGYVPPGGKEWVGQIRNKGNEATHEIPYISKEDAEELIKFIEMLLKFIYEFPAAIKKKEPGKESSSP